MIRIPTNRVSEHPGKLLSEFIREYGLSANALARSIHVPPNRLTLIIRGERGVTADTALRLGRYFGMSAEFWMNVQMAHDLSKANMDRQLQRKIKTDIQPHEPMKAVAAHS